MTEQDLEKDDPLFDKWIEYIELYEKKKVEWDKKVAEEDSGWEWYDMNDPLLSFEEFKNEYPGGVAAIMTSGNGIIRDIITPSKNTLSQSESFAPPQRIFTEKSLLKKNGIYMYSHKGLDVYGHNFELTILILFTKNNLAIAAECEQILTADNLTPEMLDVEEDLKLSTDIGKVDIKNKNQLAIRFPRSPNKIDKMDLEYREWRGTIFPDHLLLDYAEGGQNEMLGKYAERILISKVRFDFYKLREQEN